MAKGKKLYDKRETLKKRNHDYDVIHSSLYQLRKNFYVAIDLMKGEINDREDMPHGLKESLLNRLENMNDEIKKEEL